jgi:hypothetical protein
MNQGLLIALEKMDRLNKATLKFSGPPKSAIEAIIQASEIAKFAKPPVGSIEYITSFAQSIPLIAEAINTAKTKQELIHDAIFGGGHTVSNLAKIAAIDNAATEASKAFRSWDSISRYITDNANAYKEQLGVAKNISTILQDQSILNKAINPAIFDNKFIKESPRIIDVLSANTFANVFEAYESIKSQNSLEIELAQLNKTISEDEKVKMQVSTFANDISEANEDYKKIDEIATDFVDKLTSQFGLPKQYAYYIAALVIFVLCVWGKDILSLKKEVPTNITNNYIIQNNPKVIKERINDNDIITKDAPIYLKRLTSTRRIGTFKINTIVEIKEVKKDWCLVSGKVEITVKKSKLVKDSIITGWIQQRYLSNY